MHANHCPPGVPIEQLSVAYGFSPLRVAEVDSTSKHKREQKRNDWEKKSELHHILWEGPKRNDATQCFRQPRAGINADLFFYALAVAKIDKFRTV